VKRKQIQQRNEIIQLILACDLMEKIKYTCNNKHEAKLKAYP
jgi:hypothetical protein